jgi:hypothetical protein
MDVRPIGDGISQKKGQPTLTLISFLDSGPQQA